MSRGPSLRARVVKAGAWSVVGYGFTYVFRLGSNLIMTRLLVPEAFGIMAVAGMIMAGLAMFSDFGVRPSVIQNRRGDEEKFLNTAWTIQALRGLGLFFAAIFISAIIAVSGRIGIVPAHSVYANDALPLVIAAFSVTSIIAGLESTKALQASRRLSIAPITQLEILAQLAGFAVMIVWALNDRSIWALIAGAISSSVARTTLTHVWLPGCRNRFEWDRSTYDEIMVLGKWVLYSSVLYFVASNGDRIFLGGVVDPATLGAYAIAYLIFSSIDQLLNKVVVDVSFPALTEVIRNDQARLKEIYYRFHMPLAGCACFCSGVLLVSGQEIVGLLYDARYQAAGWILQLLALALLVFPFRIASQAFLALGLANIYFQLSLCRLIGLAVLAPTGFFVYGFEGCVLGIALSYFSSVPLIAVYARRTGLLDIRKEARVLPAFFVGALVGFIVNAGITWLHTLRL